MNRPARVREHPGNPDSDLPVDVDTLLLSMAARQHGVVGRDQLLGVGVPGTQLDHRLRAGRLRRLHRGVYLVGPLTVTHTAAMAAVLACGVEHAVLSHHSVAALWEIAGATLKGAPVDVIVTGGRAGSRPGIHVRRIRTLQPDEVTVHLGIPVTTPARTLFDLASEASERDLERSVAEAFAKRLIDRPSVLALLDRHARRPGACRLRRLLDGDRGIALTRSEAEERFLALVQRARLRIPETNVAVAGHEVDFFWRRERLVVEVDGRAFHSSDDRFERDRRRDAVLIAAGLRVMRVTWLQLMREPEALVARLALAIGPPPVG